MLVQKFLGMCHFILAMFSGQPLHSFLCCYWHYASDLDSACLCRCDTLPHSFQLLCNERLHNYTCLLYVTLVLWTLLEHSHSVSKYCSTLYIYVRESVSIKNYSSSNCWLYTVQAVRFDYFAPKDGDLRTSTKFL